MAETRHYPNDHPTRKGCKIVACEADQKFLDELYRYPKDHPFSIRYGGNLYVRGGERIDPDDPNAVRPRSPKLSRQAAKTSISGSGEDILNEGQRQDDRAAERAKANYEWKDVSLAVLWDHNLIDISIYSVGIWLEERLGPKHYLTQLLINISRTRNKRPSDLSCTKKFYLWGNGTVGRQRQKLRVQIIARIMVRWSNLTDDDCNYYTTQYDSNDIKLSNECKLLINKCKNVKVMVFVWVIISRMLARHIRGRSLNNSLTGFKFWEAIVGRLVRKSRLEPTVTKHMRIANWMDRENKGNGRSLNGKEKLNESVQYNANNRDNSSKHGTVNGEKYRSVLVNNNYVSKKGSTYKLLRINTGVKKYVRRFKQLIKEAGELPKKYYQRKGKSK